MARAVLRRLAARWCLCTILPMSRYVSLGLLEETAEIAAEPELSFSGSESTTASLAERCIACLLDTALLLAVFVVIDTWVFLRWSVPGTAELTFTMASLLICVSLNAVIWLSYLWLLEATFGATLGKAMVGIRVQWKIHGYHPRGALAASAIRNLLRIIDGLGFYLIGFIVANCSRLRQRLGDMCAGTVVVASGQSGWTRGLAIVLWIAAVVGSGWAVVGIHAAEHGGHRLPYLGRVVARLGRTHNSAYIKVARFKIEVQRNDEQFAPQAVIQNAAGKP